MRNIDMNKKINDNIGLIYKALEKYTDLIGKYDLRDDMVQTGMISLFKAIKTFDTTKGAKFSTYATNVIKNDLYNFVNVYLNKYVSDDNTESIDRVVFNESGDKELTVGDMIPYEQDFSEIEGNQLISYIKDNYEERGLIILSMISNGYNYEEIGKRLGISKQRVGIIIKDIRKNVKSFLAKTV